jgi:hypothetical protein
LYSGINVQPAKFFLRKEKRLCPHLIMFSDIAWLIFLREKPGSPNSLAQWRQPSGKKGGKEPIQTKPFQILVRESGVWTPFESGREGKEGYRGKSRRES